MQKITTDFIIDCDRLLKTFGYTEDVMSSIIKQIHKYKITQGKGKDRRYRTYVADETKPTGRREVRASTLPELYRILLDCYGITKDNGITFAKLYSEWVNYKKRFVVKKNKGLSPSTIRRYERDYDNYIAKSPLAKENIQTLSAIKLENYILDMVEQHKMLESNAKNVIGYITQALDYAWRADYIVSNQALKIDKRNVLSCCEVPEPKPDKDRVLTRTELQALAQSVAEHKSRHPYYMPDYAIELAMYTGMRVGEIAALHWTDIDNQYINVDYSEHRYDYTDKPCEIVIAEPKNRKHRKIPMTDDLLKLFEDLKDLQINSEWVFARETGERYTAHDISCAVDRRATEAGIKKTSIHGIRRTVSSLLNEIMPQKAVASILGHLPTTNERFYNYDTHEDCEKIIALSSIVRNYKGDKTTNKKARNAV